MRGLANIVLPEIFGDFIIPLKADTFCQAADRKTDLTDLSLFSPKDCIVKIDRSMVQRRSSAIGFSLIEVLISLFITLVVALIVFQISRILLNIYRTESHSVQQSSMITRAFDDLIKEISRAGYGIGKGADVILPFLPAEAPGSEHITVRSNTEGVASMVRADAPDDGTDLNVAAPSLFQPGDLVLVTELGGVSEPAEVLAVEKQGLRFRPTEGRGGGLRNEYSPRRAARVLTLREVRYYLEPEEDGFALVKETWGPAQEKRILTHSVKALSFEYTDALGNVLSPASPEFSNQLATVRVTLRFSAGPKPSDEKTLQTSVTLDTQSASVDFAEQGYGFRLTRYFYPIDRPMGVTSRPLEDWGLILSAGPDSTRPPSYLYTYLSQKRFLEARVENVTWLEDVRGPVAFEFGPEKSPAAGSLFVASSGIRVGHLTRIDPDKYGVISPESPVTYLDRTQALAQIGGLAFGVDHSLYVASSENGAIFRFIFDETANPKGPEKVATMRGSPGSMVLGADGHLYFLLEAASGTSLFKLPFDETLSPGEPHLVAPLPGTGISLSFEPNSGNLFALMRDRQGDSVILELERRWLRDPSEDVEPIFRLADFRTEMLEGRSERITTSDAVPLARLPSTLVPERLDFLAFDTLGLLYVGAREQNLVLKFDLDRPDARHTVEVVGVVSEDGTTRFHGWKRNPLAW
jgi:hypothetical protein